MTDSTSHDGQIAIVGLSGRFPGAADVKAFWNNLCAGVESVRFFADDELDDWFSDDVRGMDGFVKARPVLDGVELFDAAFFGMQAREAELTDPQHRVFLECAWEALEDAGHDPARYAGTIGVFAGCSMNTYFLNNVCRDRGTIDAFTSTFQVGGYSEMLGAGREFLATRVSYKLDLRGPSLTVQTACSTSLVAVAQACQSLLLYQSDMALAGGVSISFPQHRGYLHQEGGMVSADGHCRPFDAQASGTVFGSGAGVVLLKRLADALADGDHVYAVILGCGLSNDGSGKVGFAAPSVDGQVAAIEQALAQAGVPARSIGHVECHGTATPLGDPIEIAALTRAFNADSPDQQYCAIGSVKGNIGHLDAAAGVVGLIKTALMLRHGSFVPSINFEAPNPHLNLPDSPFFVGTTARPWPQGAAPRRAAVSSLGVGGTNAHVVLQEAPDRPTAAGAPGPHLLVLSARSQPALRQACANLAVHLRTHPDCDLSDVAGTLQLGRRHFRHRHAVACHDAAEAAALLDHADAGTVAPDPGPEYAPPVAFMFPGQGSQYPGMARGLYDRFPVFRGEIQRCAAILEPLGVDLQEALYGSGGAEGSERLRQTGMAQPAIFAVEYALAQLWLSWGLRPAAYIGHSVGEFVAACLSGLFTLPDALELVRERGRLMERLPPGAMLAVRLTESDLTPLLDDALDIAAVNGPAHCVISGPTDAITALERRLSAQDVAFRRLHTSHAFHSAMMDPMVAPMADRVGHITTGPMGVPWISTVTGSWITPGEAESAAYWAKHAREPVRFAAALRTLLETGAPILLEVGPGNALASLAAQTARQDGGKIVSSLPGADSPGGDVDAIMTAVGRLWQQGVDIDWSALAEPSRRRVPLPTYPFERRRYWIDPPQRDARPRLGAAIQDAASPTTLASGAATTQKEQTMDDQRTDAASLATGMGGADRIADAIRSILENVSGAALADVPAGATFLEMGFDSLLLSQVAQQIQARFKVKVAFRQLLGQLGTIPDLAGFVRESSPVAATFAQPPAVSAPSPDPLQARAQPDPAERPAAVAAAAAEGVTGDVAAVMRAQLDAMSGLIQTQLAALQRLPSPAVATPAPAPVPAPASALGAAPERHSRFNAYRPAQKVSADERLPAAVQVHIDALTERLTAKTAGSKRLTAQYRPVLADPRAAAGFRREWKELVYPIVCVRSHGSRLWDVDGNEYIDLVNGYGPTAFGHGADFITDALREQLDKGFATGPQAEFAGEIAALFTEITGNERMTFCNTGSEAVMAALRIARAVTGRSKVVMFSGAYHGQFDEVLVRRGVHPDGSPRALPVASGIPASAVENMVVLDFATPAALEWVRQNAEDLAAVIVEPVQSRHPDFQPFAFLHELRAITERSGTAFIMDEIVTGFRVHPGGMQAVTGIRADLATYGKIIGGGLPIGILAGKAAFMDALDGGQWRYGDDSVPEAGVTFFAGTFVRHPLALAAVRAVLRHIKAHGPSLQDDVARRAATLAAGLTALFRRHGMAANAECYSSFIYFSLHADDPLAGLLFHHLRDHGIHAQDGFPLFLTTAHTDDDIARILAAFDASILDLASAGIVKPAPSLPAPAQDVVLPSHGPVPLTESQMEIWLAAQRSDAASCAFNESVTLRLTGPLDRSALIEALTQVVARHDALRLCFGATGEQMWVLPAAQFPLDVTEPAGGDGSEHEEVLARFVATDAQTPFDLTRGQPVRARLFRLSHDQHALVLTAHHIVCDGWSINVIVTELAEIYAALQQRRAPDLGPALPFTAYAEAQSRRDASEQAATLAYWAGQFAEVPDPIELPTDRPRRAQRSHAGGTRTHAIGKHLYQAVKATGARNGSTMFTVLLAAFEMLMGRIACVEQLVVAVPTAGQSLVEDRQLVGHCVNFLPIRGGWEPHTSVADHLRAVGMQVMDAYEHQECTLGTIVRDLDISRRLDRLPLTEIQFNLERLADDLVAGGIRIVCAPNPKQRVNYDIFWNVIESKDGLRIDCDYNSDLFEAATIDRWLRCYEALLESMTLDLSVPVTRIAYLPAAERDRLVHAFNATATDYPRDLCVQALFEAQAARRPDAAAIRFRGQVYSYADIDARANRLAQYLQATLDCAGARVGVLMKRSDDMIVALIAAWKAGCAYVPLDPAYPAGRLRGIAAEADLAALLTDGSRHDVVASLSVPAIDVVMEREAIRSRQAVRPEASISASNTAYVIFTSGSTGAPKGVEVSHRSVVNLLTAMAREPGLQETDVLLAVTTIAFDIAGLELFLPLSVGAVVAVAEEADLRDGFRLLSSLKDNAATVMQATPALWRLLVEADFHSWPGLKMLCGGEALPRALAQRLLEGGGRLWNMYGPTETTIWSSCAECAAGDEVISVGSPIANTQMHILDTYGQLVPTGAIGELFIGGDGLAAGYFRRDDLTSERFVTNPLVAMSRLYRTGDIARRLPDGRIQVLGRSDNQVKLRGFRIELGEVEAALIEHAEVAEAAVLLRDDAGSHPMLVAYVAGPDTTDLSEELLRRSIADYLPDYMIPSRFVQLASLPRLPNGKLDRGALPAWEWTPPAAESFAAPQSPLEEALARIWADVLKLPRVGRDDDLFSLGADSIHLFQIAARGNREGLRITARQLLDHPSIAQLIQSLDASAAKTPPGPALAPAMSLLEFQRNRKLG